MPLQIRRGTEAERLALTTKLAIGELLFTTDQGKLWIGDGTDIGSSDLFGNSGQGGKGLVITGFTAEESQDATAVLFSNGTHTNISFTYNDASDSLSATVNLSDYTGNINVDGNLSVSGIFEAAGIKSSIFADDSTKLVDAVNGVIPYSVLDGAPTALSSFTNDVGFITVADIADGAVTIDVNNTGDLVGSVFGDDSTLLVDSSTSKIVGPISINDSDIFDDVSGLQVRSNQTTGNLNFYSYGSDGAGNGAGLIQIKSSGIDLYSDFRNGGLDEKKWQLTAAGNIVFPDGTIQSTAYTGEGSIFGDDSSLLVDAVDNKIYAPNGFFGTLSGDVIGYHTGDVKGSVFGDDSALLVDAVQNRITGDVYGTLRSSIAVQREQNSYQEVLLSSASDSGLSNYVTFSKARGTFDSPTAVQSTDTIYDIQWAAYDGAAFQSAARIRGNINGAVSSGVTPGNLSFDVADTSGTLTTRMSIDPNGLIRVVGDGFLITSDSEEDSPIVCRAHFDTTVDAPNLLLQRSRGTAASPTALQLSDKIFDLGWGGYSPNGNYNVSTRIRSTVYATPSGNTVPGQMELAVRISSGGLLTGIRLNEHEAEFQVMPRLPTFAGDVAAATACGGTPVNGMMYYDSNTTTIRAYAGGSWVSL